MGLRALDPVERVDDHTVTVHFARSTDAATMLYQLTAYPLVPEHALRDVPIDTLSPFGRPGGRWVVQ